MAESESEVLMLSLDSKITEIAGVGEMRAKAFYRMGFYRVRDLLFGYPRAYENRGAIIKLSQGDTVNRAYALTVATAPKNYTIRAKMTLTKFRAFDDTGSAEVVFFNQSYIKNAFHVGERVRFWGKLSKNGRTLQLASPAFEKITEKRPLPDLVPVYRMTDGLTRGVMEKALKQALEAAERELVDHMPYEIIRRNNLCSLRYAIKNIHNPEDREALERSGRRLAFDEALGYALAMYIQKEDRRQNRSFVIQKPDMAAFSSFLPFELTGAQKKVISQIEEDMCAGTDSPPMSRVVIGDVGCGKTICAAAAMYIAAKGGRQAALMAPTEILAKQHYNDLAPLFAKMGIECALLTGSTKASVKKSIKKALSGASPLPVVIGTHALLTEDVDFARLGLVITDEQHRFGVMQRAALGEKGRGVHVLVMSATPIPRTLTLALYGDLDVSKIDEMPPGRQRVSTYTVDESYRDRLYGFIRKQVDEGGQVYIVCPAIEESGETGENENYEALGANENTKAADVNRTNETDRTSDIRQINQKHETKAQNEINVQNGTTAQNEINEQNGKTAQNEINEQNGKTAQNETKAQNETTAQSLIDLSFDSEEKPPLKAAVEYAKKLSEEIFPDITVAFLHGRMKNAEKDAVMGAFVAGEVKILVSTTVIEVGVNVPNATLMVVENAERFGLSQLHQLRGRVGRGKKKSYCVLVSDSRGKNAKERLLAMRTMYDGYRIAEKDLEIRGPGDFFSQAGGRIRQSGGMEFRLASMSDDAGRDVIASALKEARRITAENPALTGEYAPLKAYIFEIYDLNASVLN